jgi:hypothetical protein
MFMCVEIKKSSFKGPEAIFLSLHYGYLSLHEVLVITPKVN